MSTECPSLENFRHLPGTNFYRCGSPELGTSEDLEYLTKEKRIKTLLDFRTKVERQGIKPERLEQLCRFFPLGEEPKGEGYRPSSEQATDKKVTENGERHHYVYNLMSGKRLVAHLTRRLPWYVKIVLLVLTIVGKVTGSKHVEAVAMRYALTYAVNPFGITQQYVDMLDCCGGIICEVLQVLTEPRNSPCLLSCATGKDRTGVITALVLSVLGFSREDIAEDYAKSEENLKHLKPKMKQRDRKLGLTNPEFAEAKKETMLNMLEHIDTKYGSMAAYLTSIGFDTADQARLRVNMSSQ